MRRGHGRWASCDPAGRIDGMNIYQYAKANPISLVDPFGLQSEDPATNIKAKPEKENQQKGKNKSTSKSTKSAKSESKQTASQQEMVKAINDFYSQVHDESILDKLPWTYRIEIHRFVKLATFAGGFEGDNRDFTAKPNVTSRTNFKLEFDASHPLAYLNYSASASESRAIGTFSKIVIDIPFLGSSHSEAPNYAATAVVSSEADYNVRSSGYLDIHGHSAGALPLITGAPDIDTYVKMVAIVSDKDDANNRALWIAGEVRGNDFPWAEVIIEDHLGNRMLLGTFDASGGGPLTHLWGSGIANRLLDFGLSIPVGPTGAFSGIISLDQNVFYKVDNSH